MRPSTDAWGCDDLDTGKDAERHWLKASMAAIETYWQEQHPIQAIEWEVMCTTFAIVLVSCEDIAPTALQSFNHSSNTVNIAAPKCRRLNQALSMKRH